MYFAHTSSRTISSSMDCDLAITRNSGFFSSVAASMVASIIASRRSRPLLRTQCGRCEYMSASMFGSSRSSSIVFLKYFGSPRAMFISSGFFTLCPDIGVKAPSPRTVASERWGTLRPSLSAASVIVTLPPPAPPTIATFGPLGRDNFSRADMVQMRSSFVFTEIMPVCLHSASHISREPAIEAVCELTAREPPSVRPPFHKTSGFLGLISFAISKRARPSLAPSRYMPMISVSSSSARYRKKS